MSELTTIISFYPSLPRVLEQPPNKLLIVVMFLAFDNDLHAQINQCLTEKRYKTSLLPPEYELVPAFLRKVLFSQEFLATVNTIFMFLRDAICEIVLTP